MLGQLNIYGMDKVEVSIERFKAFEPKEGYFLAFSGGKDSCVIKALADMAGVKYDAHYNVTSVDPPELIQFIKKHHPDVNIDIPRYPDDYKNEKLRGKQITMWNLIPKKKMPPTRIARYCCEHLKESSGEGRFVVTGVRWEESSKRKNRGGLETAEKKSQRMTNHDPDNPDQGLIHNCMQHRRRMLNPIIDWTTDEVWEFIHEYKVPYCELYDQGYKRLGCIGCPMGSVEHRLKEFEKYPKYKQAYIRAFDRMIDVRNRGGVLQPN
jgi:phosphoadenosine phosphosulfate reductase